GRPVPGGAGAVLLPRQDQQGDAFFLVGEGGVIDGHHLAVGQVAGPAALGPRREQVPEPDVGEGAPHHHLVVAPAGAIGVEVGHVHAPLLEILGGGRAQADGPGGGDVVGG